MRIGELDQHCGNCKVIDYCSEPFSSLCLCTKAELKDVEESMYIFVAEKFQSVNKRKISNQKMYNRICEIFGEHRQISTYLFNSTLKI